MGEEEDGPVLRNKQVSLINMGPKEAILEFRRRWTTWGNSQLLVSALRKAAAAAAAVDNCIYFATTITICFSSLLASSQIFSMKESPYSKSQKTLLFSVLLCFRYLMNMGIKSISFQSNKALAMICTLHCTCVLACPLPSPEDIHESCLNFFHSLVG